MVKNLFIQSLKIIQCMYLEEDEVCEYESESEWWDLVTSIVFFY